MEKKYNIALDIGTNSVGWSVTNDNYELIKFKKKNMWGVRLFETAETAKTRRVHRNTRRRLGRRKNRIRILRQILEVEVLKKDPIFFIRLEEAFLHKEDRTDKKEKWNLFFGKDFNDKAYYKKYPTIYHLRKELIQKDYKADIRLIYLALHHIIKYRGNFLYEGQNFNDITNDITESFNTLIIELSGRGMININISIDKVINILDDTKINKSKKVEDIIELFNGFNQDKKIIKEVFNGIVGLQFNAAHILVSNSLLDKKDEKIKIKFSDDRVEEKLDILQEILDEDYIIIELMKKIYNWVVLSEILQGETTLLSEAMINRYIKFKNDLKKLKAIIINNFSRQVYVNMFKNNLLKTNYVNYMNNKCKNDVFGKEIEKLLKESVIQERYIDDRNYILNEIKEERFLIKQNNTSNSTIPFQLNENELKLILEKQSKFYPEIKENKEKIIKLLTFRVPYYIGPLNNYSKFSWVKKIDGMEKEKIYPWNFHEVIDIYASAEKFITRMTNYCTYLPNEKVIPKYSLLYSEYMFYNEINKLRVDGKLIADNAIKEKLKKELFLKQNIVSEKDLINWFRNNQFSFGGNYRIEGLQGDKKANASLKSFIDFNKIFGEINSNNRTMIEKIIFWLTVYEDTTIVKRKINNDFKELSIEQINKICKLKYEGWSRLSEKLLTKIYINDKYNTKINIMNQLKRSNMNFMQIINDNKLGFNKKIDQSRNSEELNKITYNEIKLLQGSPAIKRGVWQSTQIVDEIVKIMGGNPERIFIEFARSDGESKRTLSRKNKLIKLYEAMDKNHILHNDLKDKDTKINNVREFLYYIQLGKCMYTQERLERDTLNLYDIDHIIPQSYIKDDSVDNMVLVKKKRNQEKSDEKLPMNMVKDKISIWWEELYKYGFISAKKYRNLTTRSFNEGEERGFINRQLVETRQISMHVTNLLSRAYGSKGTKIVAIKAQLGVDFKNQFNIFKNRSVNDYHHAHDAYITSVIGEYLSKRFSNIDSEFIYNEFKKYKKTSKGKGKFGFIISSMNYDYVDENGKKVWEKNSSIASIKKILDYKDCNITKKVEYSNGQMFNIMALKKPGNSSDSKGKPIIPLKKNLDIARYGGYNGEQDAYFVIIRFEKGKKEVKQLVGIPIRMAKTLGKSDDKLEGYLKEQGYKNAKILKNRIGKYQLFKNSEGVFYLAAEKEWHNAKQLLINNEFDEVIYDVFNNIIYKNDEKVFENKLVSFYNHFIQKVKAEFPVYLSVINKIESYFDNFEKLSLSSKIKVIKELLKLTSSNSQNPNLKDIGGVDRMGRLNGKNLKIDETLFIDKSVTGLFEKSVRY